MRGHMMGKTKSGEAQTEQPAVMRDTTAAMAMAAAPYLHARLSTIDAKLEPAIAEPLSERPLVQVQFVVPGAGHARGDNE